MKRNQPFTQRHNINFDTQSSDDQNSNQNQNIAKLKKNPTSKPINICQVPIKPKSILNVSIKVQNTQDLKQEQKWKLLPRFMALASKSHYIHQLKFSTLFLAYSLAQKTVHMVSQKFCFQYWTVVCLFLSMKYEEIYPPRLRDLSVLVKKNIKAEQYFGYELRLLEQIQLDMNFISLNTMLSEFLHAVNPIQRYYIFYLLQIALFQRSNLKKFNLREIVLSVMFVLSTHRLYFSKNQKIDGFQFERIEQCSKIIILSMTYASDKTPNLYRKYKSQKMKHIAHGSVPKIQALSSLLTKKAGIKQIKDPKVVGFCSSRSDSTDQDQKNQYPQSKYGDYDYE